MGAKGLGKTGETYIFEKVAEHFTGEPASPEFSSASTAWGEKYEPEAKEYFTAATKIQMVYGSKVRPDFKQNNLICGTPDDILQSGEAGIEIKCPYNSGNHLQNLLLTRSEELLELRPEYFWQIYGYMWLWDLKEWKFCSYDPRFKDDKRMLILSMKQDVTAMNALKNRVTEAKLIFNNLIEKLKS
jgi:hypothetical protein